MGFDPAAFRDEVLPPVAHFDIVPSESLATYGRALPLMNFARLHKWKRMSGRRISLILDECTNIPYRNIIKEITLLRSRGINLTLLYQSISALKEVYGEKNAATITSNACEQFLSCGDLETAEAISKRVGDHTVSVTGKSFSMTEGTASTSISHQAKRLLPVDEVLAMGPEETILFVPGIRPIRGRKVPYFEQEPLKHWVGTNPQERHLPSPITRLRMDYTPGRTPRVVGGRKLLRRALAFSQKASRIPKVPVFDLHALLWLPIAVAGVSTMLTLGTPHFLFTSEWLPEKRQNRCLYVGFGGLKLHDTRARCEVLTLLPEDRERRHGRQ
ncbi:MAG: type IV secretory system conjugative DNA transfer family protein [Pseudomonadota bacterium]